MIKIVNKNLKRLTTIRTPSITEYYTEVNTIQDIEEAILFMKNNNLSPIIIGGGTNLLFTKENYEEYLFIKLGKKFQLWNMTDRYIELGGASLLKRSGMNLLKEGYKDFLYMSLIPGSLGGAIRQNAGTTKEGEIKDNFISAEVYDLKENKLMLFDKNDMQFQYRNSLLQNEKNRFLLLKAKFELGEKVESSKLLELARKLQQKKREKEPKGFSFGSTFKSIKYPKQAWWYIDQVGLRNKIIGGAKFSEKHSNWIINWNNATANDILDLIKDAEEKVYKHFNIRLEKEVELI